MSFTFYQCPCCKRSNFKSQTGLTQHQERNLSCCNAAKRHLGKAHGQRNAAAHLETSIVFAPNFNTNNDDFNQQFARHVAADVEIRQQLAKTSTTSPDKLDHAAVNSEEMDFASVHQFDIFDDQDDSDNDEDDSSDEQGLNQQMSWESENASDDSRTVDSLNCDISMLNDYKNYVKQTERMVPYDEDMVAAIRLLCALRHTKASMQTHEKVMEWHLQSMQKKEKKAKLTGRNACLSRKLIFKALERRHVYD